MAPIGPPPAHAHPVITKLLFALLLRPPMAAPDTTLADRIADSARVAIEVAYASGRPEAVVEARRVAERGSERFPADGLLKHYVGYALFREGLLRTGDSARAVMERARDALRAALEKRPLPETHAVLASVYGNLIPGSVLSMIRYGRASSVESDAAVEAGPGNPRAWLMKGAGALYQPALMGGGPEKAEAALRKAIALFATDRPALALPAWGQAEAWGFLALALAKQGKTSEAQGALAQGLALDASHAFLLVRVRPVVQAATGAPARND